MKNATNNWVKKNEDGSFNISDWTGGVAEIVSLEWEQVAGQIEPTLAGWIKFNDGRTFFGGVVAPSPFTTDTAALYAENKFRQAVLAAAIRATGVEIPAKPARVSR